MKPNPLPPRMPKVMTRSGTEGERGARKKPTVANRDPNTQALLEQRTHSKENVNFFR